MTLRSIAPRGDEPESRSTTQSSMSTSAVDQLTASCVAMTIDDCGRTTLDELHGLQLIGLVCDVLGVKDLPAHGKAGVLGQHLLSSLLGYRQHFAPSRHWALSSVDAQQGLLRWTCRTVQIPDVVDVFSRHSRSRPPLEPDLHAETVTRLRQGSSDRTAAAEMARRWAPVIRHCDPTTPAASTLTFVGEGTHRWCAADDPIVSREAAWPDALSDAPGTLHGVSAPLGRLLPMPDRPRPARPVQGAAPAPVIARSAGPASTSVFTGLVEAANGGRR